MLPEKLTVCRVMEMDAPKLPPRSRLYSLAPIGVGTPRVESLTGYIARLAEAHCVSAGTLLTKEIVGRVADGVNGSDKPPREKKPANHLESINGVTATAVGWVEVLEALTHRHDLRALTMLAWAEVLPWKGLLRSHRAWCPHCLEENGTVYEPLLWSIEAVKVCPEHKQPLASRCPHCREALPNLGWQTRPGHCSKCRLRLSGNYEEPINRVISDSFTRQLWAANVVGEMLAASLDVPLPERRLVEALRFHSEREAGVQPAQIARWLGESKVTVRAWLTGTRQPQLGRLLDICRAFNTTPLCLLTLEAPASRRSVSLAEHGLGRRRRPGTPHRRIDLPGLKGELEAILRNGGTAPPSMVQVSRRLGFGREILYKHYPELCRAISTSYLERRAVRGDQRRAALREEVRAIVNILREAGIEPTNKEVARRLAKPGAIRDKVARATLNEILPPHQRSEDQGRQFHNMPLSVQHGNVGYSEESV